MGINQTSSKNVRTTENKFTLDKRVNFSTFIAIKPSTQVTKRAAKMSRLSELDLHFDNIKTILKWSNATPVRCKINGRYACGYCLAQFKSPSELKTHTLAKHEEHQPEILKSRSLWKYIVYLDITSLICKKCDDDLDSLKELMEHLLNEHEELVHLQIKNQIVPCKFDGDVLKCGNCMNVFDDFDSLEEHMDEKHYRNCVCDFCDKGYMIRNKLLLHKKSAHRV